ncbi:helix-turn-helix domain-containing protein [Dokdonia sp.]|uniref:helix-turn-helix domain-containing protein n=1 Tax=Dokdonia sp. TaxID=2024995 RepID=UPI0032660742
MKLLTHLFTCILFLCISNNALSQNKIKPIDTLKNKTAQELYDISTKSPDVSILERAIHKAKKENNLEILIDSYYYMGLRLKDEKKLQYHDSIIALKDQFSNILHPANSYYAKGVYFFNQRNFIKATDYFIKANEYANRNYNQDIIVRTKQSLGLLKKEIGDYEQALILYKENFKYTTSKDTNTLLPIDYLEVVFSIASIYSKLNKYDSVSYYNDFGIKESLRLKNIDKYNDFVLNTAETLFNKGEYNRSLDSLHKVHPYYESSDDQANLSVTYYYLAKNYFRLQEDEKAIQLLEKIDSLFQENNDTRPKVHESYALLISYYKNQNNLEKQIIYQEKIIDLISMLHTNELYLNKKIVYDYDIPVILANNQKNIDSIEAKKKRTTIFAYCLLIIIASILIILFYLNKKRKLYKKRFEELINKKGSALTDIKTTKDEIFLKKSELSIPEEVIAKILSELENFEKEKDYLNSKISISLLAKTIGTNPNYLSKTVNHFKKMSFSQYINMLRIEHSVGSLKSDTIYRKYTLKAIAAEFGFNNTESFSKAFYKETGIKPSYFIKNLEKSDA